MTKEHIFESLNKLKKPVIVQMYKNLYEDREELLEKHQTVLKNWGSKIAELEEENTKLQDQVGSFIFADSYDENNNPIHKHYFKTYKESCAELSQENCRLRHEIRKFKEQLKNAYCPKYKTGQEVWFIDPEKDISNGTILFTEFDNGNIFYSILDVHDTDYTKYRREEEVFTTKVEAQKYLEEQHANN